MREIPSEPAWQHFLKQNSFQPELALSDSRDTKMKSSGSIMVITLDCGPGGS